MCNTDLYDTNDFQTLWLLLYMYGYPYPVVAPSLYPVVRWYPVVAPSPYTGPVVPVGTSPFRLKLNHCCYHCHTTLQLLIRSLASFSFAKHLTSIHART